MALYNAGNDFVAAFSAGVRDRMEAERMAQQQQQFQQEQKIKQQLADQAGRSIDAEAAMHLATIGAKREELKNLLRQQIFTGERKPTIFEPAQPGQNNMPNRPDLNMAQVSPLAMLPNNVVGNLIRSQVSMPSVPQPPQVTEPATDMSGTGVPPGTVQAAQPEALQVDQAKPIEAYSPTSTQYVNDLDPALFPGGTAKLEGVVSQPEFSRMQREAMLASLPIIQAKAAAESTGKAEGEKLVEAEKSKNAKALKEIELKHTDLLQQAKDAAAMQRTQATVAGQRATAEIRAAATRYAADKRNEGRYDPGLVSDIAAQAALGDKDITKSHDETSNRASALLHQLGQRPLAKNESDGLRAINDTNILMRDMKDFTAAVEQRFGNKTSVGTIIQQIMASKIPAGDPLFQQWQAIQARAGNISHAYGGEIGRLTDQDIKRALGLMTNPNLPAVGMRANLKTMEDEISNRAGNKWLAGANNVQKRNVLEHIGLDPVTHGGFTKAKDGTLFPTFARKPDGTLGAFDKNLGKNGVYVPIQD